MKTHLIKHLTWQNIDKWKSQSANLHLKPNTVNPLGLTDVSVLNLLTRPIKLSNFHLNIRSRFKGVNHINVFPSLSGFIHIHVITCLMHFKLQCWIRFLFLHFKCAIFRSYCFDDFAVQVVVRSVCLSVQNLPGYVQKGAK